MLNVPLNEAQKDYFSIVGIDPGSDTMGISHIKIDIKTFDIVETTAWTIKGSKMVSEDCWLATLYSYRRARIKALKENLIDLFNDIDPTIVTCESPFYNPRRPNAYGVLVEVLTAIGDAVIEYDIWKPLYLIDPSTIKKSVGAPGNADKTVMKTHVCKLQEQNVLKYKGKVKLQDLDEHSIDAIATGYCKYKTLF